MKKNTNLLLKRLVLSTTLLVSATTIAEQTIKETTQPPSKVSKLLKELRTKQAKAAAERNKKIKPQVKKKHKPTKIKPKPVEINTTIQQTPKAPVKKWALPNFLHNIYIRADYGMGMPLKSKISPESPASISYINFKRKSMYGGGIGYKFNQAFRSDITFQFRELQNKNTDPTLINLVDKIQHFSVFLNTYLHLMDENSYISPLIIAGVGYSENKIKDINFSITGKKINSKGTSTGLAWNVGAGFTLRLAKHLHFETNYKFVDIGKVNAYNVFSSGASSYPKTLLRNRVRIHEISGGFLINL